MGNSTNQIKLFISYSHDDEAYFNVLSNGLKKIIKNSKDFEWEIWDDTKIYVGTFWDDEIQANIKDCNIALLLVSVGFMSSSYIKEKEFNEFKKKYAENGILIFPIVFSPCDFNQWDDLGKLQFFKPSGSDYGKPDIKDFTYSDLIKFIETNGMQLPNPNINRYHLDLFKKIEESYKAFLIKNNTSLATKQNDQITNQTSLFPNKLSDYPKSNTLFTGRKKEISELKKIFDDFRIFAIEGIGGSGKTQIAAKFIEENLTENNRIIWLNGFSQSNFDVFVEGAGYGDVLKGKEKKNIEVYSGLKDLIEKDKRIIFWDNFNDYEDSSFTEFLSFAHQYLKNSTIILITKTDPVIEGIMSLPSVKIEGLEKDAIEYAKKLKSSNSKYSSISETDLEKICNAVEGHPLAIEFSMLLVSYGKTVNEIILHMPEYSTMKKVEEFSKRLFLDILYHPKTTEEEKDCFLKCSVLKEKFTNEEIKFLYGKKDIFPIISGLIDKLLISLKDGYYEIHPLVRSFSYEKLVDKIGTHENAANYFISKREKNLDLSLEEKILYHLTKAENWESIADIIEKIGEALIKLGQLGLLLDILTKLEVNGVKRDIFNIYLGDIHQIRCEWNDAINYYKKAEESSTNNYIIAESIIKYGEILFRKGDYSDSLKVFENGYEFSKTNSLKKELARSLNDIGLVHYEFDKLDLAKKIFNDALKIREEIGDINGICSTNNNIANIYDKKGKYHKAIEIHTKNIKIATETNDRIALGVYVTNISSVLRKHGKLVEALEKVNLGLEINQEIGDKTNLGFCLINFGGILIDQNELIKGRQKFEEAFVVYNEISFKKGLLIYYLNIGLLDQIEKNYIEAIKTLFISINIARQIGAKYEEKFIKEKINSIKKEIGNADFKELLEQTKCELKTEYDEEINIIEFLNEPIIRIVKKYNRNDKVKVQYKGESIKEVKFKTIEKDLIENKCDIID